MGQALTIGLVTNYFFKIHMDRRIYKLQSIGRRQESSVLQYWMGQALTIGLVTNWLGQNNVE